MKLNDPFGRMERRHQAGYESMRDALRRSNINTVKEAREVSRLSKLRTIKFVACLTLLFFIVVFLFPDGVPVAFGLAFFLAVWSITSTINGHRYIQRYIQDELEQCE